MAIEFDVALGASSYQDEAGACDSGLEECADFQQLYAEHFDRLVRFCRRQLCGSGDPEAVAQEALFRAWASWDHFTPGRPFWPWVSTIARRMCIDHRRAMARQAASANAVQVWFEYEIVGPDEKVETAEEHRLARAAFSHLKPGERRMVNLRDIDGWSYEQIAEIEGVTVEAIRSSLKRARAALRVAYERVAQGVLGVFGLAHLRRARTRVATTSARLQPTIGLHPAAVGHLGDVLAGAVALTLAVMAAGPPAPTGSPLDVVQAATAVSDEVVETTAPVQPRPAGAPATPEQNGMAGKGGSATTPPLRGLLPSDGVRAPEDAEFSDFTPSPRYADDGIVLGVGHGLDGCLQACAVLFRSDDRGATWERLPGLNFRGGRLLLSPSFPDDPRIFANGPTGLQVSDDGGRTFRTILPVTGPMFMSPAFSHGDPRIIVGTSPGWEYRDDIGTSAPLTFTPPPSSVSPSFSVAFPTTYRAGDEVFLGGSTATSASGQTSAVFRCRRDCEAPVSLPGSVGAPNLTTAATPVGEVLFAWNSDRLFSSSDGGGTFRRQPLPGQGRLTSVVGSASGSVFAVLDDEGVTALFASRDGGRTWTGGPRTDVVLRKLVAIPGGTLLSAPPAEAGGGILCSRDRGSTWARRCN